MLMAAHQPLAQAAIGCVFRPILGDMGGLCALPRAARPVTAHRGYPEVLSEGRADTCKRRPAGQPDQQDPSPVMYA